MEKHLKTLLSSLNLTKAQSELYRKSFYDFSLDAFKTLHNGQELIPNWHIKLLCDRLQVEAERIVNGGERDKHLLINVPPRTLKSELVNVFFSVYCWILKDSIQFISSSYSASLSIVLSTQSRRLIESDWFIEHFPDIKLSKDENTKSRFTTTNGGLRYSTSTGGTVTGMGGDVIVIDDPQNPQLARSEVERDNANRFFNETLRSRLNNPDKGIFIVIMQRLHENDMTGMLLEKEPHNWEHICLPAELSDNVKPIELQDLYVDGLLFPQRLSKSVLDGFKTGLGSYGYSGQYSQLPSPSEGGIFKGAWFNTIKELPNNLKLDQLKWDFYLDTAYTNKQENDATAMLCAAFHNNELYIREVRSVRMEFPELIKEIQNFTIVNGYSNRSRIYVEPKASGKSIVQMLKRSTGLNIMEDKPPTQDKISRASSISAFVESGRVSMLDGRYIDNFLNELKGFPNAKHDDMVDVLIMAIDRNTNRRKKVRAMS
jgi:predicted phage terminase large subunit-like protein